MNQTKLLCDQMLGSLAIWLRFLGIDTYYSKDQVDDDELLSLAERENRILITKDKELIIRATKKTIPTIIIQTVELDKQIQTVLAEISFEKDHVLTRCSQCNTSLISVKREEVQEQIPPKVFKIQKEFWSCPYCKKIYWKGSHYHDIMKKIRSLK